MALTPSIFKLGTLYLISTSAIARSSAGRYGRRGNYLRQRPNNLGLRPEMFATTLTRLSAMGVPATRL